MLDGVDLSNFNGLPATYRTQVWYQQAQFIIAQAIPRPAPTGYTGEQLAAATADGKPCGIYTWIWHNALWRLGDRTVADDQRVRLATVPDSQPVQMRPWLDIEDNQSMTVGTDPAAVQQRKADVLEALGVLDAWAAGRGLPKAGVYWSTYFVNLLFDGDNAFIGLDRVQWLANYGVAPGNLISGDVVAHQYTSTPVDRDMMLESEIMCQEAPSTPTPDCSGLVGAVSYMGDDLADQLYKASTSKKVRAIADEMRRVRVQFAGPRP